MIKSDEQYKNALIQLENIFDSDKDDEIDMLVDLIEKYEEKHHKISGINWG